MNCSCLTTNETQTAVTGLCDQDCSTLYPYLALSFVGIFFSTLVIMPTFVVIIRYFNIYKITNLNTTFLLLHLFPLLLFNLYILSLIIFTWLFNIRYINTTSPSKYLKAVRRLFTVNAVYTSTYFYWKIIQDKSGLFQ